MVNVLSYGNYATIFLAVILTTAGTAILPQANGQGFVEYSNSDYGISIDYPASWHVLEGEYGTIVAFYPELASDSDVFAENVNIVSELTYGLSLDEYTTQNIENFEQFITDFVVISDADTNIAGNPARKLVYTYSFGDLELKTMQVITIANSNAYIFTYTGLVADYPTYLSTADDMAKSMEFFIAMQTYEDLDFGIEISYPNYWEVYGYEKVAENVDRVVYFGLPKESTSDSYQENVDVLVEYLESDLTLDEYTAISSELVRSLTTNFMLIESVDTTLAGYEAHKTVFVGQQGTFSTKTMQVYTIVGDKVYVVSYNALSSTYSKYLATAEEMIGSFTLDAEPIYSIKTVGGAYADAGVGLEIEFPDGWSGIKVLDFPVVTPGGLDFASKTTPEVAMIVFPVDKASLMEWMVTGEINLGEGFDLTSSNIEGQCSAVSHKYLKVNDMSATNIVLECTTQEGTFSKMNMYGLINEQKMLLVMLVANSQEAYDDNIQAFVESVNTLRLDGVKDFKTEVASIINLSTRMESVVAAGADVDIRIDSSSEVSNFEFDEENKKISFTVEGEEGTYGHTIVSVGNVLQGDYMVTIDGEPAQDYSIAEDEVTGEITVEVTYSHSVHEIAITGTNVVPEFPTVALVLTAIVGATIALSRTGITSRWFSR